MLTKSLFTFILVTNFTIPHFDGLPGRNTTLDSVPGGGCEGLVQVCASLECDYRLLESQLREQYPDHLTIPGSAGRALDHADRRVERCQETVESFGCSLGDIALYKASQTICDEDGNRFGPDNQQAPDQITVN